MERSAQAVARANIALVKYFGKADAELNLPAVGSLALTLDGFSTHTRVTFSPEFENDEFRLNGDRPEDGAGRRVSRLLDLVRQLAGFGWRAQVESRNDYPTAAGLASSASGFAALAAAALAAAGIEPDREKLAELARRGSGSAPRSLLGGFTELRLRGKRRAPRLVQVAPPDHWQVRLVVAQCADGPKAVGSREGMERARLTSPFYSGFLRAQAADLKEARQAVLARDLEALGTVAERSCFKMHGLCLGSCPPLVYLRPASLAAVERVWELRRAGHAGYVTMDAGPQVKVLCLPGESSFFACQLAAVPGVVRVWQHAPGAGVEIVP